MMRPSAVFAIIWIGWIVSWIAAAFWSARTEKRVATWPVWVSRVALLAGAVLLLHSTRRLLREPMLWHVGYNGAYALAGLTPAFCSPGGRGFISAGYGRAPSRGKRTIMSSTAVPTRSSAIRSIPG